MYAFSSISIDIPLTSGDARMTTSAVDRSNAVRRMFVNGQCKSLGSCLTGKIGRELQSNWFRERQWGRACYGARLVVATDDEGSIQDLVALA